MRLVYLLPLLALTACGYESPTWMPDGFTRQNAEYKAQPGPEAATLGYPYTEARNEYLGLMWDDVAKDLVGKMEAAGVAPQPVYIRQLPDTNAFNMSLDHALRSELRERGYTLTGTSADNLVIGYQGFKPEDEKKRVEIPYNEEREKDAMRKPYDPEKPRKFVFVLTMERDNASFGEVRTQHILPAYGYKTGEGNLVPPPRVMEGVPRGSYEPGTQEFNQ